MASSKITILLILVSSHLILCKPIVKEQISSDSSMVSSAHDARVARMQINDDTSPMIQAGIAHVNGRFGKSIRAFTVNEFEKYIGGLAYQ